MLLWQPLALHFDGHPLLMRPAGRSYDEFESCGFFKAHLLLPHQGNLFPVQEDGVLFIGANLPMQECAAAARDDRVVHPQLHLHAGCWFSREQFTAQHQESQDRQNTE